MIKDVNSRTTRDTSKWYNNRAFPLFPHLSTKKASKHNTRSFTFTWLFFTIWSLDHFSFEISAVCDAHWGLGIIGILPYLRWSCTIPIPSVITDFICKLTSRSARF